MNLRIRTRQAVTLDLTPLIDVVFLLLIFFMVSTTFDKQTQLKVDLPEASPQVSEDSETDQIKITIDPQGHFYVNDQELVTHDLETLMRALRKVAGGREDLPVIVSSDRNAPFQAAIMVMDAAGQLNLNRLSFVARHTAAGED